MIRQTRLGEAGMSTWVTPRCESASTTALMTVAGEPMVPFYAGQELPWSLA